MKTLHRIGAVLLIMILLSASLTVFAVADGNAVQNARNGVARVVVCSDGYFFGQGYLENIPLSYGSGFFVGLAGQPVRYIVTNRHVIEDTMNYDDCYINVVFDSLDSSTTQRAIVLKVFDDADLAVLELQNATTLRSALPIAESSSVSVTDTVYALGFPAIAENEDELMLNSRVSDISVTKGSVTREEQTLEGCKCINTDATISHGNSGGPLVDEKGNVVAINCWGRPDDVGNNINFSIVTDYIINYLNQARIPYETAKPKETAVPETPKPSASPVSDERTDTEDDDSEKTETNSGLRTFGITVAVIVILGASYGFYLLTREKTIPEPRPRTEPEPVPVLEPRLEPEPVLGLNSSFISPCFGTSVTETNEDKPKVPEVGSIVTTFGTPKVEKTDSDSEQAMDSSFHTPDFF